MSLCPASQYFTIRLSFLHYYHCHHHFTNQPPPNWPFPTCPQLHSSTLDIPWQTLLLFPEDLPAWPSARLRTLPRPRPRLLQRRLSPPPTPSLTMLPNPLQSPLSPLRSRLLKLVMRSLILFWKTRMTRMLTCLKCPSPAPLLFLVCIAPSTRLMSLQCAVIVCEFILLTCISSAYPKASTPGCTKVCWLCLFWLQVIRN